MSCDRKLVTIRQVDDLMSIEGADFIELARVDGWQCIVKKGEFSVGDHAVYFEVDSVLPNIDVYHFLKRNSYVDKDWLNHPITGNQGLRIKTMKMKGHISQGLLLPVPLSMIGHFNVGDDVTDQFDVIKWDPPIATHLRGRVAGNFPTHLWPKTDQDRVQNCFYRLQKSIPVDTEFEATIKLDGSSCTIAAYDGQVRVCSRNLELKIDDEFNSDNAFCKIALRIRNRLLSLNRNLALQGELMGPGIQGNREGFKDIRWFVFDVWDIDNQRYLSSAERTDICAQLDVDHCPIIGSTKPLQMSLSDLLELSNNQKSLNHSIAEGIVYKSLDGKTSFKVISNRFLLKEI